MVEINSLQLKEIQLKILREIHEICINNEIRYSLAFGSLLGAIRHKGFIPWDDDIDIALPRPDYDRFVEYCKNNETPFALISNATDEKYCKLFSKAFAKNTVVIDVGNRFGCDVGVSVDVFPIDGLGDTLKKAKKNFEKFNFSRELLVAVNWRKFTRSKSRSAIYEPARFAFYLLSRPVKPKRIINKIEKAYRSINFDTSRFAGVTCGAYRLKEIMPQEIFAEYVDVQFEGETFKAFKNYHHYLTALYGDYMTLPPENKRVSHHDYVAYFKEENK